MENDYFIVETTIHQYPTKERTSQGRYLCSQSTNAKNAFVNGIRHPKGYG